MKQLLVLPLALLLLFGGCATTQFTDTARTATEQLLLSDAVDSALESMDFEPLRGRAVYFDARHLAEVADKHYVEVAIRRKLARAGVRFSSKEEEAEVVVQVGAGVLGTNRSQSMIGLPQTAFPSPFPAVLPEVALIKKTSQTGAVKLFVFGYERSTGIVLVDASSPIITSDYRAKWVFGIGPYESGTVALRSPSQRDDAPVDDMLDVMNPFKWFEEPDAGMPGQAIVKWPFHEIEHLGNNW